MTREQTIIWELNNIHKSLEELKKYRNNSNIKSWKLEATNYHGDLVVDVNIPPTLLDINIYYFETRKIALSKELKELL
mgnify:CR=1 FL=1